MQNTSFDTTENHMGRLADLSVTDLVSLLRNIPAAEFSPQVVVNRLQGVHISEASLQRYLSWKPRSYTRNSIYRDAVFEILAVCWEPGSCSPIHDHSGQDCWLYVHAGSLSIESFDLIDPSQEGHCGEGICVRKRQGVESIHGGAVDHRGPLNDIHRVVCRRASGQRAVSLHVYARPFDDCVVYESSRGRAVRKKLSYDTVDGQPISAAPSEETKPA